MERFFKKEKGRWKHPIKRKTRTKMKNGGILLCKMDHKILSIETQKI